MYKSGRNPIKLIPEDSQLNKYKSATFKKTIPTPIVIIITGEKINFKNGLIKRLIKVNKKTTSNLSTKEVDNIKPETKKEAISNATKFEKIEKMK